VNKVAAVVGLLHSKTVRGEVAASAPLYEY